MSGLVELGVISGRFASEAIGDIALPEPLICGPTTVRTLLSATNCFMLVAAAAAAVGLAAVAAAAVGVAAPAAAVVGAAAGAAAVVGAAVGAAVWPPHADTRRPIAPVAAPRTETWRRLRRVIRCFAMFP